MVLYLKSVLFFLFEYFFIRISKAGISIFLNNFFWKWASSFQLTHFVTLCRFFPLHFVIRIKMIIQKTVAVKYTGINSISRFNLYQLWISYWVASSNIYFFFHCKNEHPFIPTSRPTRDGLNLFWTIKNGHWHFHVTLSFPCDVFIDNILHLSVKTYC